MIGEKLGFLFLHIPKTGGNAIQNVLMGWSDDAVVVRDEADGVLERLEVTNERYGTWKHSTLDDYAKVLDSAVFRRLYKFAVIRNPWDRMISFYFSPHRGVVVDFDKAEFEGLVREIWPARKHVVLGVRADGKLDGDIDYLMRFEELQSGFDAVCGRLGLGAIELPRLNCSRRGHYTEYYDAGLRDLVAERFAEEIEFGGYRFGV